MLFKKRKIKKLAKEVWENKWKKITDIDSLHKNDDHCSFCEDAEEKCGSVFVDECDYCLLPKYFCYWEEGFGRGNTLLGIMYNFITRGFTHSRPPSIFSEGLSLVRQSIFELIKRGKVKKKTEEEILLFNKKYGRSVSHGEN